MVMVSDSCDKGEELISVNDSRQADKEELTVMVNGSCQRGRSLSR